MASIKVDFPDPFSPTKKVTLGWNGRSRRCRIDGRLYG